MWVAKIKIDGANALMGSRAKKFKVSLSGYPVASCERKDGLLINFVTFVFGEEKNIKAFISDLKKEKRITNIEANGNFVIGQLYEPSKFKSLYHYKHIHIEPMLISDDGSEIWTIGNWDKKELSQCIKIYEQTHNAQLLRISKEKIKDFSIISIFPKLTVKQREALELAIKQKYYDYPRKVELEKLAQMMNLSYSTFHAHLRKAEQKILPFFFVKLK